MFRRGLAGVTTMTLLSYGGEYMAFTSVLTWLYNLTTARGVDPLQAYGFGFFVSAVYLLVSGVLAVPFGSLSDRFGRRPLAVVGCVAAGLSILALPATALLTEANFVILAVSLVLLFVGIGHGTFTASALAYAGDISSSANVGQAYGLVETAEYAMFMFGTPLGFIVAQLYGNTWTFVITGGILLTAALAAVVGMPERRKSAESTASSSQSGEVGKTDASLTVAANSEPQGQIKLLYKAVQDSGVLIALLAIFFVSMGFTAFRIYMTQYGTSGQAVPFVGPYLISIMAIASTLAAVPIGKLVDLSKKRMPVLIVGFVIEAIALVAILVNPTAVTLIAWSVAFGVAIMLVRIPQAVIVAERTQVENRAGAMGANHAVEHIGYGAGAFLGGLFVVSFGLSSLTSFAVFGAVSLVAGLVFLPLWKKLGLN